MLHWPAATVSRRKVALHHIPVLAPYSTLSKSWREDANQQLWGADCMPSTVLYYIPLFTLLRSICAKQPYGVGAMIISTHRRGNREARCWRRASPSAAQSLGSHRAKCIYLPNAAWCQPTGQQNGRSEQSSSNCGQEPEGRTCASTITTQRATATLCQRWHQHVINMRSLTSASSPLL